MEAERMIGRLLGHYRIREKVGVGGMGEVYRARDETLGRDVALKILPPGKLSDEELRKRFRSEALALSRLNHPYISTVHQFGSDDGIDYLVMEFIEGPTLDERLAERPLSKEEILRIGLQLADAVAEAHEQGIVHRDLKPANIKLTRKGTVKVLDFGLAKLLDRETEGDPETPLTATPAAAGTVRYMAPEQLEGKQPAPRTDVWAFGAVLYELAARRPAFEGRTIYELATAIMNEQPAPLPDTVPPELRAVIERCMEKDPERRFQNGGEVRIALETIHSGSIPLPSHIRREHRRKTTLGFVALALVAAAVGLVAIRGLPSRSESPRGSPALAGTVESIVALPSRVFGPDEDGFLADAFPQTMSTELSRVEGLITKVPPTSAEFARLDDDLGRAAVAYGVNAFVLSTVTADADSLVLNVQLVDAESRSLLWGGGYEGTRSTYLDLVREAADGIRRAIRPTAEPVRAAAGAIQSSEAELALQRGLYHLNLFYSSRFEGDLEQARDAYEQALEVEPNLAEATAGIAQVELLELYRGADPVQAMQLAEVRAREALQLDPQSSQAWQLLSALEDIRGGDTRTSLEYALRAVTFGPRNNFAHIALGNVLMKTSSELGVAAYTEAQRQNPLDLSSLAVTAGPLALLGRPEEGLTRIERALGLEPGLPWAIMQKALVLTVNGRTDEAAPLLDRLGRAEDEERLPPGLLAFARDLLEFAVAGEAGGETGTAARQRLIALARGEGELFTYWDRATQSVAPLLARYGETEAALEVLTNRFERGIADSYDALLHNPHLSRLQGDPRFKEVLSAARDRFDDMVAILQEARVRDELPVFLDQALADVLEGLESRSAA